MRARRLMADLDETRKAYPDSITLKNNSYWVLRLPPTSGPYRGYALDLGIEFPENYPFASPTLRFERPVFHPQVSGSTYEVCQAVYKSQWRAAMTPKERNSYAVVEIVMRILENPEPASDDEASVILRSGNRAAFESKIVQVMGPRS